MRNSPRLEVMTPDFPARIEKVDDINDLALIRIDGISPRGRYNPLSLGLDAKPGDTAFALGHPGGVLQVHVAPGKVESAGTQLEVSCNNRNARALEHIRRSLERQKAVLDDIRKSLERQNAAGSLMGRQPSQGAELATCEQQWTGKLAQTAPEVSQDAEAWLRRPALAALLPGCTHI